MNNNRYVFAHQKVHFNVLEKYQQAKYYVLGKINADNSSSEKGDVHTKRKTR